jgi:hypothetical protein
VATVVAAYGPVDERCWRELEILTAKPQRVRVDCFSVSLSRLRYAAGVTAAFDRL